MSYRNQKRKTQPWHIVCCSVCCRGFISAKALYRHISGIQEPMWKKALRYRRRPKAVAA